MNTVTALKCALEREHPVLFEQPKRIGNLILPEPVEGFKQADWQKEDLDNLEEREWGANWSEMGCYKTSTALWLMARQLRTTRNPRVLVVTNKTGKGAWFRDAPKVLPGWALLNLQSTGKTEIYAFGRFVPFKKYFALRKERKRPTIVVAHYHCFTNKAKARQLLEQEEWDMIVLDEAHRIKERNTQWTRHLKMIARSIPHRHIMTGTGFINRPDEIWSLLNFLNKDIFGSYKKFRDRYCDIINIGGFDKIVGILEENEEEFKEVVRWVGPRRRKNGPNGVFEGKLHEPIVTPYPVDLNPTQRKMYDEIKYTLRTLDQNGEPIFSPNVLSLLNRLRQICVATPEKYGEYYDPIQDRVVQQIRLIEPSSKLDALMDILDGMEWDDEYRQQVVVFSNFKDPIELAKKRFDKAGISYLHMDVKHTDAQRQRMWLETFPKKEHQVFICTLQLGGESIDLTPADTAIFLDRSWSPKDNNQGIGRIYRPGQVKIPQIIHINARSTTDQRLERANEIKEGWFNSIFGEEDA